MKLPIIFIKIVAAFFVLSFVWNVFIVIFKIRNLPVSGGNNYVTFTKSANIISMVFLWLAGYVWRELFPSSTIGHLLNQEGGMAKLIILSVFVFLAVSGLIRLTLNSSRKP